MGGLVSVVLVGTSAQLFCHLGEQLPLQKFDPQSSRATFSSDGNSCCFRHVPLMTFMGLRMDQHPGSAGKGRHAGHSASLTFGCSPTFPVKYSADGSSAFRRWDKGAAASRGERQNTAFKYCPPTSTSTPPSFSLRSRILILLQQYLVNAWTFSSRNRLNFSLLKGSRLIREFQFVMLHHKYLNPHTCKFLSIIIYSDVL